MFIIKEEEKILYNSIISYIYETVKIPVYRTNTKFCMIVTQGRFSDIMNNKKSKKINNDQELIQSDPISCPQNQKGNN